MNHPFCEADFGHRDSRHYLEQDPRDSDLQSLPDAPDASHGHMPMLSVPVCGLAVLILAVYGVFALVRSLV